MNKRYNLVTSITLVAFLAALVQAQSGAGCTVSWPQCGTGIVEGDSCGPLKLFENVEGPISGYLYACRESNNQCQPQSDACNELVRYPIPMMTFNCGDGPTQACVVGGIGTGESMNRRCTDWAQCDPNVTPLPIPGVIYPGCTLGKPYCKPMPFPL